MPQKTKKAKMAAEQKRSLRYSITEKPTHTGEKPALKEKRNVIVTPESTTNQKYFIQDLRKSMILIVIILGIVFLLYFARISNYFLN